MSTTNQFTSLTEQECLSVNGGITFSIGNTITIGGLPTIGIDNILNKVGNKVVQLSAFAGNLVATTGARIGNILAGLQV